MKDLSEFDNIKTPKEWIEETLAKTKELEKGNQGSLDGKEGKGVSKNGHRIEIMAKIAAAVFVVSIVSTGSVYAYNHYAGKYKMNNTATSLDHFENNVDENGTPYNYEGIQKVDKKTVGTREDVDITVVSMVTEPHKVIIRFEVKEKNGGSLISNDENRVSIVARQRFENVKLIVGDREITDNLAMRGSAYVSGKIRAIRVDDVSDESRAIFELTANRDDVDFTGQNIKVVLENYLDSYYLSEGCGFMFENVAEVVAKGQLAKEDAFFAEEVGKYSDGRSQLKYHLEPGNLHIQFSDIYKDAYIDNMGFHSLGTDMKKDLSFFMTIAPGKDKEKLQHLSFKNLTTGTLQHVTERKLDDGRIELCVSANMDRQYSQTVDGIYNDTTIEHLKNYILVLDNPNKEKTEGVVRYEGKWEVDIQADKDKVSVERTVNDFEFPEEFVKNNKVAKINSLKITDSQAAIDIEVSCNDDGKNDEKDEIFRAVRNSFVIIMQDGKRIKPGRKGGGGYSDRSNDMQLDWPLDNLVVSKDIKAIEICGYQVDLD